MKYIFLFLMFLNITYAKEFPTFVKDWQGIYVADKQAFQISDNCYNDEMMGGIYCEIGYSKNGSAFDDWDTNFYTEKPNDMNYSVIRIINLKSPTKAIIKIFSMEYNNDFCDIEVEKQNNNIVLKSGKCKIGDFILHKEIFTRYKK
ncbi:hypothetical protein [Campylobacter sp. 2457A]|uniref:hypothetical protein n=1 Tax=Campylobacter sp. 2457A TaxID=2735784 RepID=UPI00301D0448|nr:hypothetical protein [Campylobacter sp. 2457A]